MRAADRAVLALGATSLASALFTFTDGYPWEMVAMPGPAVVVAVVLGLAACAAGAVRAPVPAILVGAAFLVAAVAVVLEQTLGERWLEGTGSTFSLWLGLGAGLVAAGIARRLD
jgi:peptidoglycan/LPS O-acetylase OafA/YrhL